MLVPDTLFFWIMQNRSISCFPAISLHSVRAKRAWNNKSPEEKAKFSEIRSKVQKRVFRQNPKLKKAFHKGTSESKLEFWENIDEDKKKAHIAKMSAGMKKAWDESDENFGPRVANRENVKILKGNIEIERDLPRINDYCGVLTESQLAELHG